MRSSKSFMLAAGCALGLTLGSPAQAILITSQLAGDIRSANPDGIQLDVSIDVTGNKASWIIDLNSPLHPSAKLDKFYFNLSGTASEYAFSNYSLGDWTFSAPGAPISGAGAGGGEFLFQLFDRPGSPKQDVTNDVSLSFDVTKLSGLFTLDDFLSAPFLTADAGSGQLGAHVKSLTVGSLTCPTGNCSSSGFALGSFLSDVPPPPLPEHSVPEPGTAALLAIGVAGFAMVGAHRRKDASKTSA